MADQRDYGDENDYHRPRTGAEVTEVIFRGAVARQVGDRWLTIDVGPLDVRAAIWSPPIYGKQMTLDELPASVTTTICPVCGGLQLCGEVHLCGGGE